MIHVMVYDDLPHLAESWANTIQAAYSSANVTAVGPSAFQDLMAEITRRRNAGRSEGDEDIAIGSIDIDGADIVVVDYDLLRYSEVGDITGSRLAYLFRCFTNCGLIIVLNEYGTNTFDMSLRSPSHGFADLHLGEAQIGNPGLWTGSFDGYRPWHWPILPHARANLEKCVEDVLDNLDQPILEFFRLDRHVDWMPRRAHDFFLGSGDIETVRFETFVKKARSGIESKDELSLEYIARVAATRLIALLNNLILPEQSLLIDAPHLVTRFPSLIRNGEQDLDHWNRLCDPLGEGIDDLLKSRLAKTRFEKQHWLWRPAWYWPDIASDNGIDEIRNPWTVKDTDWVFCENVSRFIPAKYAVGFRADVAPPFNKRYVLKQKTPKTLAFMSKVGSKGAQDPLIVEYVPQAAFSV